MLKFAVGSGVGWFCDHSHVDTGVLIQAVRGDDKLSSIATAFLDDPLREYVTSDYVKVELLPQCTFHNNLEERQFYDAFFEKCAARVPNNDDLLEFAIEEGGRTGISGIDAIHVACAMVAQAQELITTEKTTKSIHKANSVKVISIRG